MSGWLDALAQASWLALPVVITGVLHMWVVKRNLLAPLAVPIDGGATLGGAPLLGPNKTWRGVVFMTAGGAALGALQGLLLGRLGAPLAPLDYAAAAGQAPGPAGDALGYALVSGALGLGYAAGELPNSFLKRRLAIAPGRTHGGPIGLFFFLLDQADSVVAGLLVATLAFGAPWPVFAAGSLALTALHLALNAGLHRAGVRRNL